MSKDSLGDRIKDEYEFPETSRKFLPGLPIVARIDGRGFSRFTRDMEKPYDERMAKSMIYTTKKLVEGTHATIGYTQSDEISIVWIPKYNGDIWFDRKIHKMTSVLSGLATSAFINGLSQYFEDWMPLLNRMPHFDCRVVSFPSMEEAANAILWRQNDASKNSLNSLCSAYYSANQLDGKSASDRHNMLYEKGINWNDYSSYFKRGIFVRKECTERLFTIEELERIPAQHRPSGDDEIFRKQTMEVDIPPLTNIINKVGVLFNCETPIFDNSKL